MRKIKHVIRRPRGRRSDRKVYQELRRIQALLKEDIDSRKAYGKPSYSIVE